MSKGHQDHSCAQVLWEEEDGVWRLVWTMVQSTVPESSKGAQWRRGLLNAKGGQGRAERQPPVTVTQQG